MSWLIPRVSLRLTTAAVRSDVHDAWMVTLPSDPVTKIRAEESLYLRYFYINGWLKFEQMLEWTGYRIHMPS